MTLHWWMHWFWVTALLSLTISSGYAIALPQTETLPSTDVDSSMARHSDRQGRAMYFTKTIPTTSSTKMPPPLPANTTEATLKDNNVTLNANDTLTQNTTENTVRPTIQWTPVNTTEIAQTNETNTEEVKLEAATTDAPEANSTEYNATVTTPKKRINLTRHPETKDRHPGNKDIEQPIGVAESRIVTEKPLSLETAFLQTRVPPYIESSRRIVDQPDRGGLDTGVIAGISFAALVLAALAGSTAFVLFRRRYLNKPQTLNDKCSNPDSSGYLDDSTIRDNSEEMYSLDNDSFLNSLEAMTIQNYWTDTVKHTKL